MSRVPVAGATANPPAPQANASATQTEQPVKRGPGRPPKNDGNSGADRPKTGPKPGQRNFQVFDWIPDFVEELAEEITENPKVVLGAALYAFENLSDEEKFDYCKKAKIRHGERMKELKGEAEGETESDTSVDTQSATTANAPSV
jgi:hypothetical protein